jgi:hypothetical protein
MIECDANSIDHCLRGLVVTANCFPHIERL